MSAPFPTRPSFRLAAVVLAAAAAGAAAGAKPLSDIVSLDKRRAIVDQAAALAKPQQPSLLPQDLKLPFSPPGFDQPDPDEHPPVPKPKPKAADAAAPGAPPVPQTDRQTLDAVASMITPSGTIVLGGQPMLIFGKTYVRIGGRFSVTYKGTVYPLELIAINGTTFTLRLNREEVTRPIQKGK